MKLYSIGFLAAATLSVIPSLKAFSQEIVETDVIIEEISGEVIEPSDQNIPESGNVYIPGSDNNISEEKGSNVYFSLEEPKKKDSWFRKIRASGAVQTEFLIPYNFKGKRTGDKSTYEKDVLNNTYFDLTISAPYIAIGGRFQWTKWPLPGYDKGFGGWGVPYFWATGTYKCWQLTAGDFYEQFGSGLILRIYQVRSLGVDNAIRGGRFKIKPAEGVHVTVLAGRQRRYWEWNSSWIWGGDAEWTLDQTFSNKFNYNYGLTLGVSYVGKHDSDERIYINNPSSIPNYDPNQNYYLKVPLNVAAFDARVKLRAHDFNFLVEYATKNNDPNSLNNYTYRRGNVILLSGTYSNKGFSALLQAKRSENMEFRSKRVIDADYTLSSYINHMPAFTLTQTYALAAMYPYATQADGEWAFQADVRYLFKKGTPLGGKYGTSVRLSASYISGLDYNFPPGMSLTDRFPGSDNFGAPFWKIGSLYYADLNFELNKKLSRKFQFTLFYMFQKYNQTIVEGHGGMVTSNIIIGEGQWKMSKKTQMRFELQYLQTKQDKGDWIAGLLEFSFAPHWMVTLSDTYNSGTGNNYYEVLGTYAYRANRFTFGYGKVKEGYNCSGGVCRWVPQTEGFKVSYSYTF